MPYKIYPEDGKFQVRKLTDAGEPGEAVGNPHDKKSEALAHLRALYSNVKASEEIPVVKMNLMSGAIHFEADATNPRLLHFKDYVLARAEVNKNRDSVDEKGIEELAETIPGMPIDYNHDPTKNVGFFTAGRVGTERELRTDGSIWLDRCEENGVNPDDVIRGKCQMSIEADGDKAECSICHGSFFSESQYCEHIRVDTDKSGRSDGGIRAKIKSGAVRIMRGLRAMGGAFTYNPAGTDTGMDNISRVALAASHYDLTHNDSAMQNLMSRIQVLDDIGLSDLRQTAEGASETAIANGDDHSSSADSYGIRQRRSGKMTNDLTSSEIIEMWLNEIVSAVSERKDVSEADKERAKEEYGDVEYADEKNKKYPLDEKHIHAAISYFSMPKNREKYSPEEQKVIWGRIKRAAKKFGVEISEDKKNEEKASMDEKETEKALAEEEKETPEEEKRETPEKEKEEKKEGVEKKESDMKAEYEAMKATLANMTAKFEAAKQELEKKADTENKLQAAQTQLTEAKNSIKAYRVNELRSKLVGSVLDEDEFTAKQDSLLSLPAEAIELMTRNRTEKKPSDNRVGMAASDQATETVTVKLYRS